MGNHYHKPERFKHGERFFAGEELVYNGELWVCLQDHIFYQMKAFHRNIHYLTNSQKKYKKKINKMKMRCMLRPKKVDLASPPSN